MKTRMSTLCAAAIMLTSLGASVTASAAAPLPSAQLRVSPDDVHQAQYRRHGDRRDYRRGCTAREALNKAERLGVRRVRIISERPRSITVSGQKRGSRVIVRFARDNRCTVIN